MRTAISSHAQTRIRTAAGSTAVVVLIAALSACSTSSGTSGTKGAASPADGKGGSAPLHVVAAENFWGSIAQQLGGTHADVKSIISNPDADPHAYEPTAADGRTVATAQYTIVNGIGYDAWADKLLSANPGSGRTDLKVGDLVGLKPGGNPHRWYSPDDVHKVIEKITGDYKKLDPADAAYFDAQKKTYEEQTLAPYNKLVADIKARYAGTPIGASESIVTPLSEGLGLRMLTPESFLGAISEGTDPTAKDKSAIDAQIKNKQIKIYVYNSQNSTPDVAAQVKAVKAAGIPVATVTETLTPAGASFQDWQVRQLKDIEKALALATGK
ncbi:metal ABC transporter solute-binding protein, Zn/Mn family [Streptomyces sp. NPDC050485]|uniref:metal ABC transporter solute-binding protein, Zn/Mn family n=1 Tax=Streptomyces sp. NPDC050485 TaxID=3365617 RepID=UPI0037BD72D8